MGLLALFGLVATSLSVFQRRLNDPLILGAFGALIALAFHQIVDSLWIYPKVGVIGWVVIAIAAARVDAAITTSMDCELVSTPRD